MSVVEEVEVWLKEMGYVDRIPESLPKICNPCTSFIWKQIISNVKPRQEVANIRKHLIAHRLKEKSLEEQGEFSYPIKEIQSYSKRQELERKSNMLEQAIEEKEILSNDYLKKNKMLYVSINQMKEKIKESTESAFLLERKSKMLEEDIKRAQDSLTLVRNLTPVEMEENSNGDEITETLQKCAEKLWKLTEEVHDTSKRINVSNSTRNISSTSYSAATQLLKTPRYPVKSSNFSRYFDMSRTLTYTGSAGETTDKENIDLDTSVDYVIKTRPLIREKPSKPRESLELLPPSHLNVSAEFDDMFLSTTKIEEPKNIQLPDSIEKRSCTLFESTQKTCSIFEKLCNSNDVKEILKQLLHTHNRQLIFTKFGNIYETLLNEVRSLVFESNTTDNTAFDEEDLQELYFKHVRKELEKDKLRAVVKRMRETIEKRKKEIYSNLARKSNGKLQKVFDLQCQQVVVIAANNFLRNLINAMKKMETGNELQFVTIKIAQVRNEISREADLIRELVGNVNKVLESIKNNCEETTACVRALDCYIFDLSWANLLQEEVDCEEIKTFQNMPVEYNRKLKYNNATVSVRNICSTAIPADLDSNSNNLQMLTTLIDRPYSPPEDILLDLLRLKGKLKFLRSLSMTTELDHDYKKYSSKELFQREEYLDTVMNKLNLLINSSSVRDVLSAPNKVKEICDLWLQMPVKDYISDDRLVDDHNYKYFEKKFDSYYNSL